MPTFVLCRESHDRCRLVVFQDNRWAKRHVIHVSALLQPCLSFPSSASARLVPCLVSSLCGNPESALPGTSTSFADQQSTRRHSEPRHGQDQLVPSSTNVNNIILPEWSIEWRQWSRQTRHTFCNHFQQSRPNRQNTMAAHGRQRRAALDISQDTTRSRSMATKHSRQIPSRHASISPRPTYTENTT